MKAATARDLALDLAGRIDGLGPIRIKRFFAGAALLADDVQFGFVMKGALYLRVNETTRGRYIERGSAPFSYAGRSGPIVVASYYAAPAEALEEPEDLLKWAAEAYAAARGERQASTRKSRSAF